MRYDLGRKTKALRVGLEKVSTILVPCEPSGDQADVGDHDPCLVMRWTFRRPWPVSGICRATRRCARRPHPAWQDFEAFRLIAALDDLDRSSVRSSSAAASTCRPHSHHRQRHATTMAICGGWISGVSGARRDSWISALCTMRPTIRPSVSTIMWRLRPLISLARVIAPDTTAFRGLHALAVDHTRCRASLLALQLPRLHHQMMVDASPNPQCPPLVEISWTVEQGGRSFGSIRHWQPVVAM